MESKFGAGSLTMDPLDLKLRDLVAAATAPNTRRAYAGDVEHFRAWGGRVPAAPQTVARYLADHAERLSAATLARRLAAIGAALTLSRVTQIRRMTSFASRLGAFDALMADHSNGWRPLRKSSSQPSYHRLAILLWISATGHCC